MGTVALTINVINGYVVNHLDGSPLKQGNSIRVRSTDPNFVVTPDNPTQAGIDSGTLQGLDLIQGLELDVDELDANGVLVDTTFVLVDVNDTVVVPPPQTNLAITITPGGAAASAAARAQARRFAPAPSRPVNRGPFTR